MFKQNRLAYKDPAERPSASAESFDAKAARKEVINSITETNGTRAYRVVKGEIGKVNAGSYEAFYKKLLKEDPTKPDWETSGKYEVSIEISEYEPSENAIDAWIDSKGGEKFLKKLSKLGKGDMEAGLSQYDYKNHTNKIKKMAKREGGQRKTQMKPAIKKPTQRNPKNPVGFQKTQVNPKKPIVVVVVVVVVGMIVKRKAQAIHRSSSGCGPGLFFQKG